jgi:hypothetical protein
MFIPESRVMAEKLNDSKCVCLGKLLETTEQLQNIINHAGQ